MIPLPECCTTCLGCGLSWCRDETPSPGEVEGLCPSCWECVGCVEDNVEALRATP